MLKGLEHFARVSVKALAIRCEVDELLGIASQVEELWRVDWTGDVLPGASSDHAKRGCGSFAHVLCNDGVVTV